MKKDLSSAASEGADIMDRIASGPSPKPAPEKQAPPEKRYKFSLSMPEHYQDYLKKASYDASEPGRIISMNQYICDLIQYDIDHGGVTKYHKTSKGPK